MLELAERLPCPLLVDEAYADFAETNCLSLVARCEKIMVSRSLSKSYALAGLRFGYLVAQPQVIEQLVKVKDSYNCDALSIAAATAAIGDQAWLAGQPGEDPRHPRPACGGNAEARVCNGRFAGQLHLEHPSATARSRPLYEQLKRDRILVRYMDYPGWGDGLRISVGTRRRNRRLSGETESDGVRQGSS